MGSMEALYNHVESRRVQFIDRLREAVAIKSVSADMKLRDDVLEMIEWTKKHLETLGAVCEINPIIVEGRDNLPPVLFGTLGTDPEKKTLVIYGHLDVQPALKSDGWATDPFDLTEKDEKLYGRGSSDDKGPVVGWINALESMKAVGMEFPVNIKFVFEGMEESGSVGLEEFLKSKKEFFENVQFVCISDNYWLGTKKPCLTYGLRGLCYYSVEVSRPSSDRIHGGPLNQPMTDLLWIMGNLKEPKDIPGLMEMVEPLTEEERKLYEVIDFDVQQYADATGADLKVTNKVDVLMGRMRYPSLSIHGIEGAYSGPGAKTVIPSKVIGKFSIRIVPNMTPEKVNELVVKHLNNLWKKRNSNNNFKPLPTSSGRAWVTDPKGPNYTAAHTAIKKVYGMDPDYTREGGSIPITITFEELTGVPVLLLPIGASDDNPHAQNEKMNIRNYIEGTKLLATYLVELGKI